ncbi:hypothetical protein DACRYDRAFT_119456 [Dacryopinax primogenitus]|uniref:TECPR1-like DysF domain-containing protein n=1 Tax=Dacryopinax primogenitus (strain DJM 731) TaxID=1858805 RepID=M5G0K9_DACPD|nr:uncharacterized protein DACRYDRAFT_119456 [Dacryopinax primogenitus]EJT97337.1 hypothetical protein DACRYDRAFT_119456 [Dacryopinax primogenitus]
MPSPQSSARDTPPPTASSLPSSSSSSSSFLTTTPTPVLRFLTAYGPLIHALSWARDVYLWKEGRKSDALILLVGWWGLCCGLGAFIRYALPLVLLYYLHPVPLDVTILSRILLLNIPAPPPTVQSRKSASPATLSKTLSLLSLLPQPPVLSLSTLSSGSQKLEWAKALRAVGIIYPFWLVFTYFVPIPILFALAGTLLLTWHAPFSLATRQILLSSGLVQYAFARAWALLTGSHVPLAPLPPKKDSPKMFKVSFGGKDKADEEGEKLGEMSVPPMRFRFDVWENQRWWMGLDWTTALLPSDPAPYTTALPLPCPSAPAPSPSTLPLPSPSQTVLPHPSSPDLQVVRKALWTWEDPDWRVLVRKEGGGVESLPLQLPELEEGKGAKGRVEEVIKRARGRTGSVIDPPASAGAGAATAGVGEAQHVEDEDEPGSRREDTDEALETDENGWVYCDNKWQGRGSKGGMGKYTRSRRWTRVALCHETVEIVRAAPGVRVPSFTTSCSAHTRPSSSTINSSSSGPNANADKQWPASPSLPIPSPAHATPGFPAAANSGYPTSATTPYNLFSAFTQPSSPSISQPQVQVQVQPLPQSQTSPSPTADPWARGELEPPPAVHRRRESEDRPTRRSLDVFPPNSGAGGGEWRRRDSLDAYALGGGNGNGGGSGNGNGGNGGEGHEERQGLRARLKGVVQKGT